MLGHSRSLCCAGLLACIVGCAICGQDPKKPISGEERAGYPSEISPLRPAIRHGQVHRLLGRRRLGVARSRRWPDDGRGHLGLGLRGVSPAVSRIILDWFHGTRDQGGNGAYKTDGPRPVEELERRND